MCSFKFDLIKLPYLLDDCENSFIAKSIHFLAGPIQTAPLLSGPRYPSHCELFFIFIFFFGSTYDVIVDLIQDYCFLKK